MKLRNCRDWHYQLQGRPGSDIDADLMVIDIDADPRPHHYKPNGERRLVLAYLSIGEAEEYRAYWAGLNERRSPLLVRENPEWKGNWSIRFWDAGWHSQMRMSAARAIAKGFDGMYLDKADVTNDLREADPSVAAERKDLEADMEALIAGVREAIPNHTIVLQNAPDLWTRPGVQSTVDGLGIEDLWFGEEETGRPNGQASIVNKVLALGESGLPAFVVEYLYDHKADQSSVRKAKALAEELGLPLTIETTDRELDGQTLIRYRVDTPYYGN